MTRTPVSRPVTRPTTQPVRLFGQGGCSGVVDLGNDHFGVVGPIHGRGHLVHPEQSPGGRHVGEVLSNGFSSDQPRRLTGQSEGILQDAVDGEQVGEDGALASDHAADQLGDLGGGGGRSVSHRHAPES